MNNKGLAELFGVTVKQLNHLKARKPFYGGTHFNVEGGSIMWTAEGVDAIASYLTTPEAMDYRASRGEAGITIVTQEWDAELVEDATPTQSLPDPSQVGYALAVRHLEASQEGWLGEVSQAYQEGLRGGLEGALGKHLGVPLDWAREALQC